MLQTSCAAFMNIRCSGQPTQQILLDAFLIAEPASGALQATQSSRRGDVASLRTLWSS